MKNRNLKIFTTSAILTVILLTGAGYSINKTLENDPNIAHKLEDILNTYYKGKTLHISLSSDSTDSDQTNTSDTWSFPTSTAEINLKIVSADVNFHVGDKDEIFIKASGDKERTSSKQILNTEFNENRLSIKELNTAKNVRIDIYIPKTYKNDLKIETVSGNINLISDSMKKIDISSISGDVQIKSNALTSVDTESVSGNIKLELATTADDLEFNLTSISGKINNSRKSKPNGKGLVRIKTISGDIEIL